MSRFPRPFVPALVGLAVAILCVPAMAQPGGGGGQRGGGQGGRGGFMMGMGGMGRFGGGGDVMGVVTSKSVRQLLGITEDQAAKLGKIAEERRAASEKRREGMRERFSGFREMNDEDRRALMEKLGKEAAERAAALDKQVAGVLTEEQTKKLAKIRVQLALQRRGQESSAFSQTVVIKYLGLSDEQVKKIQAVRNESREKMMELFQGGGGRGGSEEERAARREKFQALAKETLGKIREILTAEQRAKVKELISAERIELDMRRPGGFRRGGGEGGGPGGRRGGGEGGGGRRGGAET